MNFNNDYYGYCRVSSKDQNLERQIIEMKKLGISEEHIYCDKESGKNFNRPQYQRLISSLKPGNTLYILSIDRLGRNYQEILAQWKLLTQSLCVNIYVIDMPLLDTRKDNDLTGTFIADLVLQILSYVSEVERTKIRERQKQGIAIAKRKGVKFGRPSCKLPPNFKEVVYLHRKGQLLLPDVLRILGISKSSYYRYRKLC